MRNLVVIPVYNEQASIPAVLSQVKSVTDDPILVVDDGSTDKSVVEVSEVPGVDILRHERNLGYGKSLIDAFNHALAERYDVVVTLDCDEQHEPALIPRFLELAVASDIVSGTRYSPRSAVRGQAPPGRQEVNREITRIVNDLTGYALTDTFCGFKAYRAGGLAKLRVSEPGYGMPLQLWIQAARAGLSVVELPVPRIYNDSDRSFGRDLDFVDRRLEYYRQVIDEEASKSRLPGDRPSRRPKMAL